jgi:hypothetical protein
MKVNLQQLSMFQDYDFTLKVKTIKNVKLIKASKPRPAGK